MSSYKCISSFESESKKYYSYGSIIYYSEYSSLSYSEKNKFEEESSSNSNSALNIAMGDMLGTGIPGGLDGDMSTLL